MPIDVKLDKYEVEAAAAVGLKRRIESSFKKLKSGSDSSQLERWGVDIEGALAELAAAKALNIYYGFHYNTFKKLADVGKYEIRSSPNPEANLIVRPKDAPDAIYILVTGTMPEYKIVGWITGEDAMNKKYMRNPRSLGAAFFVPQEDLKDIEDLMK